MKHIIILFAASAASLAPTHAHAQISGNARLTVQCNGQQGAPYTAGVGSAARHGDCPGVGGSSNDALADWALYPGSWRIGNTAIVEHRSTNPNGASSESVGALRFDATDLVFTDTANPSSREYIRASLNFSTGIGLSHVGRSNCSDFLPNLSAMFTLRLGDITAQGSRGYIVSQGDYATGMIALADPISGAPVPRTTTVAFFRLGDRYTLNLVVDNYAMVGYCGQPPHPPEHGEGVTTFRLALPCDGPVFNLPAGITMSSAQLGIENNRWVGATGPGGAGLCCPADFNGDGFLDFFDYAEYVDCFTTSVCPPGRSADFNGDGFADFFDYADFVTAFTAGC